jgi:hypothetical protein
MQRKSTPPARQAGNPHHQRAGIFGSAARARLCMAFARARHSRSEQDTAAAERHLSALVDEALGGTPLDTPEALAVAFTTALLLGRRRRYAEAQELLERLAAPLCTALGINLPSAYSGRMATTATTGGGPRPGKATRPATASHERTTLP